MRIKIQQMNIDILIDCLLVYKNVDGNAKRLNAQKVQ